MGQMGDFYMGQMGDTNMGQMGHRERDKKKPKMVSNHTILGQQSHGKIGSYTNQISQFLPGLTIEYLERLQAG